MQAAREIAQLIKAEQVSSSDPPTTRTETEPTADRTPRSSGQSSEDGSAPSPAESESAGLGLGLVLELDLSLRLVLPSNGGGAWSSLLGGYHGNEIYVRTHVDMCMCIYVHTSSGGGLP